MSNLLEQASLVLIPSGYKEDVVYSEIPINGAGDMSFTRASNGTRINSQGLVEVCPWNLVQQSEDFTNAAWTTANLSVTSNSTTAPNGTTTADTITEDTSTTRKILYTTPTIVANQEITLTIYVKANTLQYIRLIANDLSENFRWFGAQFNLTALTYTSATGSNGNATFTSASITDAGNGWYRISVSGTINTTSLLFGIFPSNGTALSSSDDRGGNIYLGTSKTAYIWGAQLNIGSTAKPYFPTTDRLNVPRLTYQNGGGGCPSLLLEKQSTNYIFPSEDFANGSYWFNSNGASATANQTTSPDGTQNADKISFPANSAANLYNFPTTVVGSNVFSIYAKTLSGTKQFRLRIDTGSGPAVSSDFTATTTWQRFDFVCTTTAANLVAYIFNDSVGVAGDLYVWGAQLEASSYSTSYIQTTSSSATRVADACFKTGISSLIGQTEGVLFVDFNITEVEPDPNFLMVANLSDNSTANRLGFARNPNAGIHIYVIASNTSQFTFNTTQTTGRFKLAITYKANDYAIYLNGTSIYTNTSASVPSSMSRFDLGELLTIGLQSKSTINQAILFPTRLTNAELASLTTI